MSKQHVIPDGCPSCERGTILCSVIDEGASDYYLQFTHKCENCEYLDSRERRVPSGYEDYDSDFIYPFCNFNYAQYFIPG